MRFRFLFVPALAALCPSLTLASEAAGPCPPGEGSPPPALVDAGDGYQLGTQRRAWMRFEDRLVVTVKPGVDAPGLARALAAPGKAFHGFEAERAPGAGRLILKLKAGQPGATPMAAARRAARGEKGLLSCNPVFYSVEDDAEIILGEEILVGLESGADPDAILGTALEHSAFHGGKDIYVVRTEDVSSEAIFQALEELRNRSGVIWVEPVFLAQAQTQRALNDPLYWDQWHHDHIGQNGAKTNSDSSTTQAWDITPGGSGTVVIAVLDDGIEFNHPDLAANIFSNAGDFVVNGVDDDGNGYIDDFRGWDFHDNDNNPNPVFTDDAHGTAAAGMVAAVGGNGLGVAGSGYNCKLYAVKCWETNDFITTTNMALAVLYAAGLDGAGNPTWRGADILSMSFTYTPSAVTDAAFSNAAANGRGGRGTVMFAAAGNKGSGYISYVLTVTGMVEGTYFARFEYFKDNALSNGFDTVWLSYVTLPDSNRTVEVFDSPALPAGWQVGGSASFFVEDDPNFAFGTGRYQLRSGAITDNGLSFVRTPDFWLVPGMTNLRFRAWVDTQAGGAPRTYPPSPNQGDWLFVRLFHQESGTWSNFAYEAGVPGARRNVNGDAVATNVSYPGSHANVISVGGYTDRGYRYNGSQYGINGPDFVAPTAGGFEGVWSTDRTGTNGYNTQAGVAGNYDPFSGTSAATPYAAGVAGLLLSVNSNLTWQQVRNLMRVSAEKIGGVTYTGANQTNLFFGYGKLDAYGALCSNSVPFTAVVQNETVRNTRIYLSRDTFTATNGFAVVSPGNVNIRAVDRINIDPRFRAATGSYFRARLTPSP